MKLQKLLCVLSACSLAFLGGCGDKTRNPGGDPDIEEVSVSDSQDESSADVTTLTETTALSDSTEITTETTADTASPGSSDTGESLTLGLQKRIEDWTNGSVHMKIHCDQFESTAELGIDCKVDMDIYTYQKNCNFYMNMFGFEMKTIFDGTYTYQLDETTKTYSKTASDTMQESEMGADNTLNDVDASGFVGKGREDLNGTDTAYEEFKMTDTDGEDKNVKFYYDDAGNLLGCSVKDNLGQVVFFEYTITFTDSVDMNMFKMPSGYTEVTAEELTQNLAMSMLTAIGTLMESVDTNE